MDGRDRANGHGEEARSPHILSELMGATKEEPTGVYVHNIIARGKNDAVIVRGFHKSSKLHVAVKVIPKKSMNINQLEDLRQLHNMYRLVAHHSIIRLHHSFESKDNFYQCFELLSGQCLLDYVLINKDLGEERVKEMALRIGHGIEYLHKKGIILRNLDAKSILLQEEEVYRSVVGRTTVAHPKICELNGAEILGEDQKTIGTLGDIRYRPPEVVMNKPYNFKADSWTFGIIIFLLIAKKLPFDQIHSRKVNAIMKKQAENPSAFTDFSALQESDLQEIENLIITEQPSLETVKQKNYSKQALNLLEKLLQKDDKKRLSMEQAMNHSWFRMPAEGFKRDPKKNLAFLQAIALGSKPGMAKQ